MRQQTGDTGGRCYFPKPTSELDLQDLVLFDDVTVCVEGVAGTVHADFQTQIAAWLGAIRKHRHLRRQTQTGNGWYRDAEDPALTSVHQPLTHCFGHVEGHPLVGPLGQHVLGGNVALLPNVFVWPQNLRSNNSQSETFILCWTPKEQN